MQLDNRVTFATPEGVALELVLAGLGSRFLARLLDTVIQGALIIALGAGAAVAGSPGWLHAIVFVFVFLVVFAYDIIIETLNQRPHARQASRPASVWSAGSGEPIRFLAERGAQHRPHHRLPARLSICSASISIVITEHDQRLGDLAAGTIVARDRFPGLGGLPASITVAPDAVATWDVSAIDASEVQAVRHFLDRRLELRGPGAA